MGFYSGLYVNVIIFQISPLMAPEPPAGGWHLPRPESEEQTLASYIVSGSFSRHQAKLDRENAHIILAEAIIQSMNKLNFEARNGITVSLINFAS